MTERLSVAVIVTCHNYGRFLGECLESVGRQTLLPDEVLVVDDASSDNTPQVAQAWAESGVAYCRVELRNVHAARAEGARHTTSSVILFLDADDFLDPDYIEKGVQQFRSHDIGVVYSNLARFGDVEKTTQFAASMSPETMSGDNSIHVGSLVRREALEMSMAMATYVNATTEVEDWYMWRKVLEYGWKAVIQPSKYNYRQHALSRQKQLHNGNATHFKYRMMEAERLTLFIPFSGRWLHWPRMAQFLQDQAWPHHRMNLHFLDTSQDEQFGMALRQWMAASDYGGVRYESLVVGGRGLADRERRGSEDTRADVRMAMARIYNHMARRVDTNFWWILEDDVIPPLDVAEKLLKAFDEKTISVAAPVRSPYLTSYIAWRTGRQCIENPGTGVEVIEGNGFCCAILRAGILKDAVFTACQGAYLDFDPMFYARLVDKGVVKLHWGVECEHHH